MKKGPNPWTCCSRFERREEDFSVRATHVSIIRSHAYKRIEREQQAAQPRRYAKTEEAE